MATTRKYGRVTVNTNIEAVIQRIEGTNYPSRIFGAVWTDVKYAIFLEFGTSKMAPRAMIRESLPLIKEYMAKEWKSLRPLPTPIEVQALVDRVLVFARDLIAKNTPVGVWDESAPANKDRKHLRDQWYIKDAQMD